MRHRRPATEISSTLVLIALVSHATQRAEAQEHRLAIRDVTVVDATGAAPRPHMTVIVQENRIAAIIPSDTVPVPQADQVLEGTGKFLIPGLWDMHVHLGGYDAGRDVLPRLLASGITSARDMASPLTEILRLKAETNGRGSDLPRLRVAGPILQSPLPFDLPMVQAIADQEDSRSAIRDLATTGVDFIKVGDTLSRDAYFAVADQANGLGIGFVGHLPVSVSAFEASRAGQRSIEHFGSVRFHGVLIACSTEERELSQLVQDTLQTAIAGGESPDETLFDAAFTTRLVSTYSSRKADRLFSEFARNGTWQVPTLVALRDVWEGKLDELEQVDIEAGEQLWDKYEEVIREMSRAGVRFLAGSDLPVGENVVPLHEELVLLVEAGMSPMEALQSATRNPAEFLGRRDREGTIEVGKTANLVLLEADPLDEISNTRLISAVVLEGKVHPSADPRRGIVHNPSVSNWPSVPMRGVPNGL